MGKLGKAISKKAVYTILQNDSNRREPCKQTLQVKVARVATLANLPKKDSNAKPKKKPRIQTYPRVILPTSKKDESQNAAKSAKLTGGVSVLGSGKEVTSRKRKIELNDDEYVPDGGESDGEDRKAPRSKKAKSCCGDKKEHGIPDAKAGYVTSQRNVEQSEESEEKLEAKAKKAPRSKKAKSCCGDKKGHGIPDAKAGYVKSRKRKIEQSDESEKKLEAKTKKDAKKDHGKGTLKTPEGFHGGSMYGWSRYGQGHKL